MSINTNHDVGQRKTEVIKVIAANLNIRRQVVEAVLNEYYHLTKVRLSQYGRSRTPFGILVLKQTASRPGRNPRTGEPVMIESGHRVKFKPGEKFMRDMTELLSCHGHGRS